MAADNGLAQWADSDLVEMQAIGSDDNVTILVQVDKPNIGAQRLLIQKNGFTELDDLGIIDMCNWQTLDDFLQWGIITYPAKRYFVILWDHGSGWVFNLRPSFGSDWSSGNVLGIHNGDLRKAISTAYNNTGKKINLLAFDACVMQQIEVVFEIKDYIKVFLAPQTICPLGGFRYDRIFQELEENSLITEVELSKRIVEINVENYIDVKPIVISSIDAEKLNSVRTALDDLFNNLLVSSPNQLIIDARMDVQTLPLIGYVPRPEDDYIDIGDFIKALHDIFSNNETAQLLNAYDNTIIQSGYWGKDFKKTTGLTIWFPFQYLEFKQLLPYYDNLDWAESKWLQFLNWYYDQDDIRPTEVTISATGISDNNDFYLSWPASYDLASVDYHLVEAHERISLLDDACEDSSYWNLNGFVLTANNFYSGGHSFFSGDGSNLQNFIETKNSLNIEGLGLLDLYLYYNTEEIADSLIIEYGSFRDVHYGQSQGWQERRTILPEGDYKLKISYHTNNTINRGGGYIDDIRVEKSEKICQDIGAAIAWDAAPFERRCVERLVGGRPVHRTILTGLK